MKTRNFFYLALAFVAMSCAKEIAPETDSTLTPDKEITYVEKTFTAGIDATSTKTALENGYQIAWKKGDGVAVFDNVGYSRILYTTDAAGATTTLSSTTGVTEGSDEFYAVYPNRKQLALVSKGGDEVKGCYITPDQKPSKGQYYVAAHYMMSKADALDNFNFKSVNGFIRFTIAEELHQLVKAIYIFSNNDEDISGSFVSKWNDGEPTATLVAGNSGNRTYVRAFNANGYTLHSGDYYLSIIPTEFSKGFTVFLQMADGTQLSKRTEKPITVKENQILPMKELALADYDTDNVNYFVLWNEGVEFEMGGITVNKTNYPTAKIYSSNYPSSGEFTPGEGLTFLTPGMDNIKIKSVTATDVCIVGMEKNHRSNATLAGHCNVAEVAEGGSNFLWANLNMTNNGNTIVRGEVTDFGRIVVKNCALLNMTVNPFDFDVRSDDEVAHAAVKLDSLVVEDCDLVFNRTGDSFLVQERKNENSWIGHIKVHNNVVHSAVTLSSGKRHRLLYLTAATVDEIILTNNTFSNLQLNSHQNFVNNMLDGNLVISNNLYSVSLDTAEKTYLYTCPGGDNKPATTTIQNNYYYITSRSAEGLELLTRAFNASEDVFPALSVSPFSTLWDPVNATFGGYTISPVDPSLTPGLDVFVGAKRDDMTAESAGIDSAAYGYTTNDLGSY